MTASDDGARLIYSDGGVAHYYDSTSGVSLPLAMDYRGISPAAGQTTAAVFSLNGHKAYFLNDKGRIRFEDSSDPFGFRLYETDDLDVGIIKGQIWLDANGNELQDPSESPRVAGTVFLDSNNNATFDSGEPFAVTDSQGNYEFAGLAPGSYTVRHLIGSDSSLSYPLAPSGFNIDLSFADDIPQAIRDGVRQAADRWMKIIVSELPDVDGIDDLAINVVSGQLPGSILATGGPDQLRTASHLPYHGVITWSQSSLAETSTRAADIALH